jgi:hypothetical protein
MKINEIDLVRAANDALMAENARLRDALKEIIDPIAAMQSKLDPGETLVGSIAISLRDSASYLKGIARAALATDKEPT